MKATGAGGLLAVARLHVSDEHHDGLCPRCLPEGTKAEETVLRRVWQCPCNPTFSVTERWRTKAEDQHSSAACVPVRQSAPRNVAQGPSIEEDPFGHRGAVDSDEEDPFGEGGAMDEEEVERDPSRNQPTKRRGQTTTREPIGARKSRCAP